MNDVAEAELSIIVRTASVGGLFLSPVVLRKGRSSEDLGMWLRNRRGQEIESSGSRNRNGRVVKRRSFS